MRRCPPTAAVGLLAAAAALSVGSCSRSREPDRAVTVRFAFESPSATHEATFSVAAPDAGEPASLGRASFSVRNGDATVGWRHVLGRGIALHDGGARFEFEFVETRGGSLQELRVATTLRPGETWKPPMDYVSSATAIADGVAPASGGGAGLRLVPPAITLLSVE